MYYFDKEYAKGYLKGTAMTYLKGKISPELCDDKEFIMLAVKEDGYYGLDLASDRLRDDKDVIMEAVKSNGDAIKYASKRLQNDKDVLLAMTTKYGYWGWEIDGVFDNIDEKLKNDKDIILNLTREDSSFLTRVNPAILAD